MRAVTARRRRPRRQIPDTHVSTFRNASPCQGRLTAKPRSRESRALCRRSSGWRQSRSFAEQLTVWVGPDIRSGKRVLPTMALYQGRRLRIPHDRVIHAGGPPCGEIGSKDSRPQCAGNHFVRARGDLTGSVRPAGLGIIWRVQSGAATLRRQTHRTPESRAVFPYRALRPVLCNLIPLESTSGK